ncbi:MAG: hypothetical protein IKJ78_06190 [Bacteroidales bacterium]|nr:hypothetical protein [Bacteroidales bacterium]
MPGSNTNTIDPELLKKQQQEQQVGKTASEGAVATQPITVTPAETVETQPSESQRYLDQIIAQYEELKKQNERADKRDRVREAIGGIGDVASALAKLHYTTQYAPYVGGENLSDKARQRYEKAKANRDANLDQWMHYVLNVAGKKEQARQADRAAKLQQQRIEAAEEKERKREEERRQKAEDAALKENGKLLVMQILPALRKKEFNEDEFLGNLEAQKNGNLITDKEYNTAIKALNTAKAQYDNEVSKAQQKEEQKAKSAAGRGSSRDPYIYIPYGDGSGAKINKNDAKAISAAYGMLPDDAKNPYIDKPSDYEGKVRDYLNRHPNTPQAERIKEHFKQVEKRQQTQPSQQSKPKGNGSLLPNQKGKTTGSLLPKK